MPKPNHALALWLLTLSLVLMAAMSSAIHTVAQVAPVGQLVFWRSFFAIPPIVIYMMARREFPTALKTQLPRKHAMRGLFGCAGMFCNFLALTYLTVGVATALTYLAPIFTSMAAMFFLRERPALKTLASVFLGFGGIILILFPSLGAQEMGTGTLIGVAAGLAMSVNFAMARVHVKELTRTDAASTIAFYFAVTCTCVGLLTSLFGWADLSTEHFLLLVLSGLLGGLGHVAMSEAMGRAPVTLIAPYEYTGILWAFAFDFVILGARIDLFAVSGAALVVLAAMLVALGARKGTPKV